MSRVEAKRAPAPITEVVVTLSCKEAVYLNTVLEGLSGTAGYTDDLRERMRSLQENLSVALTTTQ